MLSNEVNGIKSIIKSIETKVPFVVMVARVEPQNSSSFEIGKILRLLKGTNDSFHHRDLDKKNMVVAFKMAFSLNSKNLVIIMCHASTNLKDKNK